MKLYQMSEEMLRIQAQLEEMDLDDKTMADTMNSISSDLGLPEKVEGSVKMMKSFEAEAKALKEEAKRLTDRAKASENKAKWLKEYLASNLTVAGVKSLDAGIFKVGFRKTPPSVQIDEGATVPDAFLVPQDPKVDKTNLKKWLKDGNEVEGISLVSGESLSIR